MVLFDLVKDEKLGLSITPGATLGGSSDERLDPDNFWVELYAKVTKGTFTGGTSPAWSATAGDRLVKELALHLGGSLTPIKASVQNLKRLALLEHGEEIQADGYFGLNFGGAFPAFLFKNGVRMKHEFETLANLTTGSPTSQSGTRIDYYCRKFPRQGRPKAVGFPIIKTVEKDLQSVAGRRLVADLNSGNLLRHMLIIPSSGTLLNRVEVSIANGEDVLREHEWDVLREQNKRDYYFDAIEPATGFGAYSFPNMHTDRDAVGKLELYADVNSEASGKVTIVTMERMNPADEAKLLAKLQA